MPTGLKRFQQTGQLHFITFSCYRRLPFLEDPSSKDILERVIERARHSHNLAIYAYVLMPEHVHLLTSEPQTDSQPHTLASFLRVIKGESSKLLKGTREKFWQARYYDFNTFTTGKFAEKVRYIHRNPVERGLVDKPEDWPWSSFRHYLTGKPGRVEIESEWTWNRRERESTRPHRDNAAMNGAPRQTHSLVFLTNHKSSGANPSRFSRKSGI